MQDKVIVIAEAGVNHNGDVDLAKRLVDVAAEAKADFVKFQTWITEDTVEVDAEQVEYQKRGAGEVTHYDMIKELELSFESFKEISEYCRIKGVGFMSTPEELKGLDYLVDQLDMPIIKISSADVNNLFFLRKVALKKRKVILSTGMATIEEVQKAYDTLIEHGAKEVLVLHCTTSYPAPFEIINLKAMNHIQETLSCSIGYSDHTLGIEVSIAAVALGAKVIEKHFTLDKNMTGPDHQASLDPEELKQLVNCIRNTEVALKGSGLKEPFPEELIIKEQMVKGIYLKNDIKKGEVLADSHINFKRPSRGATADQYDLIIGKKMLRDLDSNSPIKLSDVES